MSVDAVVKKDFQDGIRSKLLWALIALFVVAVAGWAWLLTDGPTQASNDLVEIIAVSIAFIPLIIVLVPLTGLVVSIKSIVRERELGTIKILLSLPHTRKETVIGKFLGRSALLTTAILAGFVPAGLIFVTRIDAFPFLEFLMLVLATILFGLVFVAFGIGVSALVKTETRATVAGVGVFFLLYAWQGIFNAINSRLDLVSGDALLFVRRFHLFTVFIDVLLTLFDLTRDVPFQASWVVFGSGVIQDGQLESIPSQPFYLQQWFAFVILALWIAVPLLIGYWRFESTDL